MKMRMIAFGLTALVCAGLLIVPMVVRHSIPSVAACFPQRMVEPQRVLCSGVIEDKSGMRIYCETPVMVKELFVEPGQRVEKGTPIACVAAVRYTEGLDEAVQQYSDLLPQDVLSVLASSDMTAGYSVSEKTETIYAQCDGFISTVYAEAGAVASVDTPIAGISQMRRVYMRASVTEQEIARIREGQPAIVTGIGFSGKEYAAQVSEISPMTRAVSLGATTRTTVDVLLELEAPDESLKPGFSAEASIAVGEDEVSLTLPYCAVLQEDNGREYVYCIWEGRTQKRYITTGREHAQTVEITSGICAQDLVAVDAARIEGEGILVRAKEA